MDCIKLKPDVVSLLMGVNDFGHTLNHEYTGTLEIFNNDLRKLLKDTTTLLPNTQLLLGEPFVVKGETRINGDWFPDLLDYQKVVRDIASELNVPFITYQNIFDQALGKAPASHWCPDGIHPSLAGSFLMKKVWLTAFKSIINS